MPRHIDLRRLAGALVTHLPDALAALLIVIGGAYATGFASLFGGGA